MNNYQRAGVASLCISFLLLGLTWGTYVNHAVAPVPIHELGLTPEVAAATKEAVAAMDPLMVVGADSDEDNRAKRVTLDPALREANGGQWPWHGPQETGDCNAFAACLAVETDLAWQIRGGAEYEWKQADRPWAYYGGRVRNGRVQLSGQGSVPAWSAEWFRDKGILWMDFAPPYSGSRSNQWGSKGPPDGLYEKAAPCRIESFAQMRNAQDVCNAICAGYPVLFGSMKFGTTSIKLVEGRNVARDNTSWPHAQCFVGYDGTTNAYKSKGLFRVMNSWGPNAHNPKSTMADDAPGGYYVTADVVDMICGEGMAFSISGTQGFPKRDLNFDVFGAVGMAPPDKEQTMQPIEMDPLLGIGLGSVALIVGVVLLVLGRLVGNGSWRRGIAAGGAMLAMLLVLPVDVKARDLNFSVISDPTPIVTVAMPNKIDGLNFAVFTTDIHTAVSDSVKECPLKFNLNADDCNCADDCDCKGGCDCESKRNAKPPADKLTVRKIEIEDNEAPALPRRGVYTPGGHRQSWRINGVAQTPAVYRAHIMREHNAAKYGISADWLQTLDFPSLVHLHSDLHEGTVNRAMFATAKAPAKVATQKGRWVTTQVCNGGQCRLQKVWVPDPSN